MTDENVKHTKEFSKKEAAHGTDEYDPFVRGRFPVGVRTIQGLDTVRDRRFPCEIWYPAAAQHAGQDIASGTQDSFMVPSNDTPRGQMAVRNATAQPGTCTLIIFSHSSGGNRQQSTFLCTHLSSHGYLVAALDHSEVVAAELARKDGETDEQKAARVEAWIANRVPDIRFLLDHLLNDKAWDSEAKLDPTRIGIVGHSFGGWTALAATEVERRIHAVVALAPGGSSQPKPGIIPGTLTFAWGRNVPTLYLVAENDIFLPLAVCTNYSKGLRQQNRWSSCAGPITCTSWTMSRKCTRPCGRCRSPGSRPGFPRKCGQLRNSVQVNRLTYLCVD